MKSRVLVFIFAFLLFIHGRAVSADSRQTIFIVPFDRINTDAADEIIVRNHTRVCLVNSGVYSVCDTRDLDKMFETGALRSRIGTQDSIITGIGRSISADLCATGTILRIGEDYTLEIRIIEIGTASIVKSKMAYCIGSEGLVSTTQTIVESLTGVSLNVPLPATVVPTEGQMSNYRQIHSLADNFYTTPDRPSSSDDLSSSARTMAAFRMIGFTRYEYDRFFSSALPLATWARQEQRSALSASLIGPLTCTSGFFYLHDYGSAVFFTLIKALGIAGAAGAYQSIGERPVPFALFTSIFSVATIVDMIGSSYYAKKKNRKLERILTIEKSLSL